MIKVLQRPEWFVVSCLLRWPDDEWNEVNLERYEYQYFSTKEDAAAHASEYMQSRGIEEEVEYEDLP